MNATPEERWLPVVGWEEVYEVSDLGRVRTIRTGLIRKLSEHKLAGYHMVGLKAKGQPSKTFQVHRLVLDAFIGLRPDGLVSCHNNGNPADNRLVNLRYDTPHENNMDKIRHGRDHNTNKTHCPAGHEYTPDNIRPNAPGRVCIICSRKRMREYMRRKRKEGAFKK